MDLGSRIKLLRNRRKLTQEGFARALDITPQAVSGWENRRSLPDVATLPQIAKLLGVTLDELFGVDEPDAKPFPPEEDHVETSPSDDQLATYVKLCTNDPTDGICDAYVELIQDNPAVSREDYNEFYRTVKNACRWAAEKTDALEWACIQLKENGRKDDAIMLAELMPSDIREQWMLCLHENGERFERRKKYILKTLDELLGDMSDLCDDTAAKGVAALNDAEKLMMLDKVIAVIGIMFEKGDFNEFSFILGKVHLKKAKIYACMSDRDNTMASLGEFMRCLEDYYKCPSYEKHTSAMFNGCGAIRPTVTTDAVKDGLRDALFCSLDEECFDFVRDDEAFPKV